MQMLVYQKCWQSVLARCAGFSLSKTEAQHTLRPVARYTHLVLESDSRLIPALAVMGPLRTPLAQVKNSSS